MPSHIENLGKIMRIISKSQKAKTNITLPLLNNFLQLFSNQFFSFDLNFTYIKCTNSRCTYVQF